MSVNQAKHAVISFGPFEADLQTQELKKHGVRLRLPGQSFQILKMLLERPGELVTREELQRALWPSDTYVDFDHGVNAAVNRVREALGDSADKPCFIETLPRRGYRFIIPITPSYQAASSESADATQRIESADGLNWFKVGAWILVAAGCAIAMIFAYLRLRPRPEPWLGPKCRSPPTLVRRTCPHSRRMGRRSLSLGTEIPRLARRVTIYM